MKKTRRGKVLKIVREHYLRDDIKCGYAPLDSILLEKDCLANEEDGLPIKAELSSDFSKFPKSNVCKDNHFLILDTNIILNQIDILEVMSSVSKNYLLIKDSKTFEY